MGYTSAGTFPLDIHLAQLGIGNYRLNVLATDTFNLTDESLVTFSGKHTMYTLSKLLKPFSNWVSFSTPFINLTSIFVSSNIM